MRLTVIGCSPAWPNPGGAHSGYLLESDGARLLLDCGPGVLSRLRASRLLPVDAIAISHFHLDHWGDLVAWCWLAATEYERLGRPALLVPPSGRAVLGQIAELWGHAGMFDRAFAVSEYAGGEPVSVAGFELVALPVCHFDVPAFGLSVRDRAGRRVAYSGDTGPCPALEDLALHADLFLCEATLADPEQDGDPRGHLVAAEALAAGARRILLTHRPAELPTPPGAERAAEGLVLEV